MTLNTVWEPSQLQAIDAPYVLQTLHRIALENPDDVGFLSSNLKVDENSVKSVSLIMYRKSVPGAKERAKSCSVYERKLLSTNKTGQNELPSVLC